MEWRYKKTVVEVRGEKRMRQSGKGIEKVGLNVGSVE